MTGPTRGPVVDSRRLHRQPGSSLRVVADAVVGDDLRNDVMAVAPGTAAVDVLLESVLDGILAGCSVQVEADGDCVRCLEPVRLRLPLSFQQFFAYPGAAESGDAEDADVVELVGDDLDLTEAFRDAVLLALPLTPTCRPDCPGLCPECGARLADDPGHGHEHQDPRWSDLARWRDSHPTPEGE